MQTPSDIALLQRWQHQQDALAFRALTQRYGALVFGICNRVLKNAADAEEITQDCFLKLAQDPGKVDRSVGPWLHSVAVNAAISRIRSEQRRRTREAAHEGARALSTEYSAHDLFEHVDEAISQLPDAQRHCIVGYFLEGKPRHDVAASLGVSTKTVQRKTDEAIEKIREILGQRGITTSAGALATTMAGLKVEALPPALGVALGKIAVAGHAGAMERAVAVQATTTGGTIVMKSSVALAVFGTILVGGIWWNIDRNAVSMAPTPDAMASLALAEAPLVDPPVSVAEVRAARPAVEVVPAESSIPAAAYAPISIDAIPPIANPEHFGQLTGRVVDASGQPVPGAEVTLLISGLTEADAPRVRVEGFPDGIPIDARLAARRLARAREIAAESPGHQFTATADEQGEFLITQIRYSGPAMLYASADGFSLEQVATEIVERERAETNIVLNPAKSIRGRIVTSGGQPVNEATVSAVEVTSFARSADGASAAGGGASRLPLPRSIREKTDREGVFTLWLANAMNATLHVESELQGFVVLPNVHVGAAELVTLTFNASASSLSGQILSPDGAPAASHYVHLYGTFHTTPHPAEAQSSGTSSGSGVGGSGVGGSGGGGSGGGGSGGGGSGGGGSGGGGSGGGGIGIPSGTILTMQSPVSTGEFQVETDTEGRFKIERISPDSSFTAVIYSTEGRKLAKPTVPQLSADGTTNWTLTLEEPLQIAGRVVGEPSGEPLANATIRGGLAGELNVQSMMAMENTVSGTDGSFTLDVFTGDGEYQVSATLDPNAGVSNREPSATKVNLRRGTPAEPLTITLPDPWSCRFRLVDPEGRAVPGASATVMQRDPNGSTSQRLVADPGTDGDGRLLLANLTGKSEVEVTFQADGYIEATTESISGEPGQTSAEETVVCYPAASAVARVTDAEGAPLADTVLLCSIRYGNGEQIDLQTATNAAGELLLQGNIPQAAIELLLRLPAPEPENEVSATGGFGSMPPHVRATMARRQWRLAGKAQTPTGSTRAELAADIVNDLGEIQLAED